MVINTLVLSIGSLSTLYHMEQYKYIYRKKQHNHEHMGWEVGAWKYSTTRLHSIQLWKVTTTRLHETESKKVSKVAFFLKTTHFYSLQKRIENFNEELAFSLQRGARRNSTRGSHLPLSPLFLFIRERECEWETEKGSEMERPRDNESQRPPQLPLLCVARQHIQLQRCVLSKRITRDLWLRGAAVWAPGDFKWTQRRHQHH